ncbi:MAG: DNA polymerase I [Candidatus Gastranaerophilales bacterium]|nr:DNA polymerase I [Candidatus Gastranaerophilales bacterium]
MENKKTLILIDGHALAFRMFFALERTNMQTTSHVPTWAVWGFFKAIFDLLADKKLGIKPNSIAVAFDISKATFRLEKYEDYKANRLSMPDSLRSQLELIKAGLGALDIPIYTKEGFEGDDVIGTIATQAKEKGHKTYILTGDKDSFQLVDDEEFITVLIPQKGEINKYNKQKVFENLEVYPNQVVDYKALCGDTSDNIPGIRGIGPKSASSLLADYKTLDGVYENIENITKKALKQKLIDGKESAYLSQFLATIQKDLDIEFDFDGACLTIPNKDRVKAFFQELQFYTFLKNIDTLLAPFSSENSCKSCENIVEFKEIQEETSQMNLFSFEQKPKVEEKEIKKLINDEAREHLKTIKNGKIAVLVDFMDNEFCFISQNDTVLKLPTNELKEIFENENIEKITYQAKNLDFEIKNIVSDIELSSYIKDASRKHDLITQINEYLCIVPDENDYFLLCNLMFDLDKFYNEKMSEKELKLLNEVELPLTFVLKDMEKTGVNIDCNVLKEIGDEINLKVSELENLIYDEAGCIFNINSPKQVAEILFDKMQIKPKKKGKSGNYSTNAKILDELALEYEIAKNILEHRQLMKLKTTYVDVLPKLLKEDNKIHTHFNQTVTATGRLSSSDPNLQNIPIRTDFSNRIRGAFVAQNDDYVILSADYSQVELRLLAHYSKDEVLIDAFCQDIDVHKITASKIFNVPMEMVTKEQRRKAKTVNFGIVYGQTRYGLSQTLNITPFEAQDLINKYFATYPKISQYINSTLQTVQENGYVETLFGRRRYLGAELNSRNANIREFATRAAINAPLQGTSADIIKMAMIDLHKKLKNYQSKMILQIHDELVLQVKKDELEDIKKLVVKSMELNQPLLVPLKVDIGWGENWKEK